LIAGYQELLFKFQLVPVRTGRPYQNIRIKHTIVLEDPFDDPPGLAKHLPDASPEFVKDPSDTRLEDDWTPAENTRSSEEQEKAIREKEAHNRAVGL
jgi:peptidyl-prolyl cis-trans isomerase-like 4